MENKTLIIGIIVILLIAGGAYFYVSNSSKKPTQTTYEVELTEIINEVVEEQAQEGITISVEGITITEREGEKEGYIELNIVGDIGNQEIIEKIQDKLIKKYPNCFADDSGCERHVEVKLSYDGELNSYWLILEDLIDMRV